MKIDSKELKTIKNYGDTKNISRQRIYKLVEAGKLDSLDIDGVRFIIMNDKAIKYKKQI
jgi:hypothetical protein